MVVTTIGTEKTWDKQTVWTPNEKLKMVVEWCSRRNYF